MNTTFTTTIIKDDTVNATGLRVPDEVIAALGAGKKPKVKVSLNGYTYRTAVAVLGGAYMIGLSAEHREAAGVNAGQTVKVSLVLDTEPRLVVVPADLATALAQAQGAAAAFDALSYSARKEYVRQVETAKAPDAPAAHRCHCVKTQQPLSIIRLPDPAILAASALPRSRRRGRRRC